MPGFWVLFSSEPLDLHSPLPPEECLENLKRAVDSIWNVFGSKPVTGRIRGNTFTGSKRIYYRNSFNTLVRARIVPETGGSRITLRFGMHRFALAFMVFWFAGAIGGTITATSVLSLVEGNAQPGAWFSAFIPVVMITFGVALVTFSRWLARHE